MKPDPTPASEVSHADLERVHEELDALGVPGRFDTCASERLRLLVDRYQELQEGCRNYIRAINCDFTEAAYGVSYCPHEDHPSPSYALSTISRLLDEIQEAFPPKETP